MSTYKNSCRLMISCGLIVVALSFAEVCSGANADISASSGWVATNNHSGGNNYDITGPSSAGGTFFERPSVVSSLVDTTLLDLSAAPLVVNLDTPVDMAGTITFSTTTNVDPTLFLGWYNSTNFNKRLGFGFADQVAHDNTHLRIMIQSSNASGTITSQGIFGTGSPASVWNGPSTLPSGTYAFEFHYDGNAGSPHIYGTFGVDENNAPKAFQRNWLSPGNNDQGLDRFGFLQTVIGSGSLNFTLNLTNLSYSGQTDVTSLAGDYNLNGKVDAADYVLWRKGDLAADGTGPGGTPDGLVNSLDYNFWRARFGNTPGSGSALSTGSAVPEPAALTLVILSFGLLPATRRRAAAK